MSQERWFMFSFLPRAIQQSGHLDVIVPPDILNAPELSADESVTNEGGNVQLLCQATGVPEPRLVSQKSTITWSQTSTLNHMKINDFSLSFNNDNSVQWRREDGKDIVLRSEGRPTQSNEFNYSNIKPWSSNSLKLFLSFSLFLKQINQLVMKVIEGEKLILTGVQRSDMGGYLCIASNGVPPSVSKRYDIQVNCKWPISLNPFLAFILELKFLFF